MWFETSVAVRGVSGAEPGKLRGAKALGGRTAFDCAMVNEYNSGDAGCCGVMKYNCALCGIDDGDGRL
jgi:hypothetical protein